MSVPTPRIPLAELTHRAIALLSKEFGAADTARFIGQYTNGVGDYTAERDERFADLTVEQIVRDIRRAKNPGE
jgi:hypothetical protein